jgi:hypothetical protein
VVHADPVIVPVNARACDLVKLLQLLAADLAYLAIWHLDLAVIAKYYYHQLLLGAARAMKISGNWYPI